MILKCQEKVENKEDKSGRNKWDPRGSQQELQKERQNKTDTTATEIIEKKPLTAEPTCLKMSLRVRKRETKEERQNTKYFLRDI